MPLTEDYGFAPCDQGEEPKKMEPGVSPEEVVTFRALRQGVLGELKEANFLGTQEAENALLGKDPSRFRALAENQIAATRIRKS